MEHDNSILTKISTFIKQNKDSDQLLQLVKQIKNIDSYIVDPRFNVNVNVNDNGNSNYEGKGNSKVSLIYAFCLYDKYRDIVAYLLKNKANIHKIPDTNNNDNYEPLLFAAHSLYLQHLININAKLPNNKPLILYNIKRKLNSAEWRRLMILNDKKLLDGVGIAKYAYEHGHDLIFETLVTMKQYLVYCFNCRQNISDKTAETDLVIDKFKHTIMLLMSWNAPITQQTYDLCVEFYLYEIIALFKDHYTSEVIFHEHMDPKIVAIHRPLLNDYRYEQTCFLLGQNPNIEIYLKMKK